MFFLKKKFIYIFFLIITSLNALSYFDTGPKYLLLVKPARLEALSRTGCGDVGNIDDIFLNISGISVLNNPEVFYNHKEIFDNSRIDNTGGILPTRIGVFSANALFLFFPLFQYSSSTTGLLNTSKYLNFSSLYSIGYANNIKKIRFGSTINLSMRYFYGRIYLSLLFDLGAGYTLSLLPELNKQDNLHLGISIRSIGVVLTDEKLPVSISTGIRWDILPYLSLFLDNSYIYPRTVTFNTAAELSFRRFLYGRVGFFYDDHPYLSIGVGGIAKFSFFNISLDYSFMPDFYTKDYKHYFTVKVRFNRIKRMKNFTIREKDLLNKATKAFFSENYTGAEKYINELLQINPDNLRARIMLWQIKKILILKKELGD